MLGLSLCWDDNWPRLYDPATGSYLETLAAGADGAPSTAEAQAAVEQAARLAEQAARQAAENRTAVERAAREAAEARIRQLEAALRRRQADR